MPQIIQSPAARRDLLDIWIFIALDSSSAADRLLGRIDTALTGLAEMPLSGRARPELGPTLRTLVVGNYLLIYRPMDDGIELVRVVHGARDIESMFGS